MLRPDRPSLTFHDEVYGAACTELRCYASLALDEEKLRNDEFTLACIEINDPCWRDIVDAIVPFAKGELPSDEMPTIRPAATFICALLRWRVCEDLAYRFPSARAMLLEKPGEGFVKAMVLARGGIAVYALPVYPKPANDD